MLNNTTTTSITNNNNTMTMLSSPSNSATIPNSSTTPFLVKSLMVYANNNNNNDTNFNNSNNNTKNNSNNSISNRSISLTNDISNTYTTCNTSSSIHCNSNIKGDIASNSNILGVAYTNTNNINTTITNTAVNNIKCNKDSCNNRNRQLPLVIENLSNNNCNIATGSCCLAIDSKPTITTTNILNNNNINSNNNKNITFSTLTNSLAATVGNNIIQRKQQHQQQLQLQQLQQQQQSSSLQLPFVTSPLKTIGVGASSLLNSSLSSSSASSSFKAYPSINSAYWLPSPHPSPYAIPERKLFVGMLNKKLNENDVRKLFEVHGAIEECTVLRDQNGQSKGCAFVTFATKHAAISAIKVTLNQNKTMEGCTSPLVVKFADTQKEKEQKKIQQYQANLWNLATNINIPLGQTATTVSTPMLPNPPQQASPVLGADAITPASLQLLQQLQAVGLQQQLWQGLGAQTNTADTAAAAAAGLLPPMTVQNLAALAAMTQSSLTSAATNPGSAQLTNTAALLCLLGKTANTGSDSSSLASAYMSTAGLSQFGSTALTSSPLASVALSNAAAAAAGKQIEGPEGCNLFIYHLPQEFTDTDLASTFLPFGNVISAKVFIDKHTNLSKCFGFVSFDNSESAQVAIKAMNGFQVGTKRLKVQLKKPKDASKPY